MNKKVKLVLNILKPKAKALGFSKDELEGIAADIASNLEFEDEASDEVINEKISEQVDSVIPYLKIAQKASNRVIQNYKNNNHQNDDEGNPDPNAGGDEEPSEELSKFMSTVLTKLEAVTTQNKALQTQITGLVADRENDGRRSRLKALLKDTGTFGRTVLKNFDRMKFENETEFDEFYEGVTEDLAAINQERADSGLSKLGASAASNGNKKEYDKPEVLNEKQVDELAESL